MNLVGLYKYIFSALRAQPLSSHRKKGGRFGENWRFSKKTIEFGLLLHINVEETDSAGVQRRDGECKKMRVGSSEEIR